MSCMSKHVPSLSLRLKECIELDRKLSLLYRRRNGSVSSSPLPSESPSTSIRFQNEFFDVSFPELCIPPAGFFQSVFFLHDAFTLTTAENNRPFLPEEDVSIVSLATLLSALHRNCFGIYGPKKQCIGASLCLPMCLCNHSCAPTLIREDDLPTPEEKPLFLHTFRSVRSIERGEELTFSYVSLEEEPERRRKKLRIQYGFDCNCIRCSYKWDGGWKDIK